MNLMMRVIEQLLWRPWARIWIEWRGRWEIVEHKWMMKIHKTWNCERGKFIFRQKKHKFSYIAILATYSTRREKNERMRKRYRSWVEAVKYFSHSSWHQYVIIWFNMKFNLFAIHHGWSVELYRTLSIPLMGAF